MRPQNRLLIINNIPAFYRTVPFEVLIDRFAEVTGGVGLVAYQSRRDPHTRSEWFFSDDQDFNYPVTFAQARTMSARPLLAYSARRVLPIIWKFRPTHIIAAGWDTPLSMAAAAYTRMSHARLGVWVESNVTTSRLRGGPLDALRAWFLKSAHFSVVPTAMSEAFVNALSGSVLPSVHVLNPVTLSRLSNANENIHPRLVFLGDMSRRKGFDRFAKLAEIASMAYGIDSLAWGRDTEHLCRGIGAGLLVFDARPLSEIVDSLTSRDILVIPSRTDPAPLTYSEGLALGLRMIVSDAIAYADHAAATAGVVLTDGTDDSLAAALNEVLNSDRPELMVSEQVSPRFWADSVLAGLLDMDSK